MTGSLQKKGEVYYVVYRDLSGRQKWISTKCKDYKKAMKVMRDVLYEIEHDTYIEPRKDVFSEFLLRYFEDSVIHDVEQTTFDGYIHIIKNHIVPYFNEVHLKIQDIKAMEIQSYFNNKYKQGFKTSTLKRHLAIFKRVFSYAEDMEIIRKNPINKVKLHREEPSEQSCYSLNELNKLLEVVSDDVIAPAVFLASRYGLRRGELLGLRWSDINFEDKVISIKNTITKVYRVIEKKPKTKTSIKNYHLFDDVSEYLKILLSNQIEDEKLYGNSYKKNDYVVKYPDGSPVSIGTINNHFSNVLDKNGLRHIRLHDLRHTLASLMLENGFNIKVVQNWMRHANAGTLVNIYAHISPDAKDVMNPQIEKFFTANIDSSHVRKVLEKCIEQ